MMNNELGSHSQEELQLFWEAIFREQDWILIKEHSGPVLRNLATFCLCDFRHRSGPMMDIYRFAISI